LTIIERVRSAASKGLRGRVESTLNRVLPGALGQQLGGAISKGIAQGPRAAVQALRDLRRSGPDLLLGQVFGGTEGPLDNLRTFRDRLSAQLRGEKASDVPPKPPPPPKPKPPIVLPTDWTAAPVFGEMGSLSLYRAMFEESAMIEKAWKNLYFVRLDEFRRSQESPGGAEGINALVVDVGFSPATMPGEAVSIGSANMDNLMAAERVELRMTVFDDARGSVKRWFLAKCDQAAHVDGTFGLPVEYLVTIDLTHMATIGPGRPDERLRHKLLMRPSNIEIELSRRDPNLEELQLSFTQFDTFVVPK
jgi:hypothetical protein